MGVAVALSRIGAAIGTYLVPISLEKLGASTTMFLGVAITLVGFVACVLWAEETRGRPLDAEGAQADSPAHRSAGA